MLFGRVDIIDKKTNTLLGIAIFDNGFERFIQNSEITLTKKQNKIIKKAIKEIEKWNN